MIPQASESGLGLGLGLRLATEVCSAINLNANYAAVLHRVSHPDTSTKGSRGEGAKGRRGEGARGRLCVARRHAPDEDGNNEGPSIIRAFGNFKGGALRYWPKEPTGVPAAGPSLLPVEDRKPAKAKAAVRPKLETLQRKDSKVLRQPASAASASAKKDGNFQPFSASSGLRHLPPHAGLRRNSRTFGRALPRCPPHAGTESSRIRFAFALRFRLALCSVGMQWLKPVL